MLNKTRLQAIESHLDFLCKHIRSAAPHYKLTSCLSFCVIAKSYLKQFGISSKIYICDTMVMNQKTFELFTSGKIKEVKNYDGLHYLHCQFLGGSEDEIGGHTILIVENKYIIDPSADQFHRPQKNIVANRYWKKLEDKNYVEIVNSKKSAFLLRVSVNDTHFIYEAHEIKESPKARSSNDLKPKTHSLITKYLTNKYRLNQL